jgi:ketosteroid isomerase-like protein
MKSTVLVFLCLLSVDVWAQQDRVFEQIDEQLWIPYIKAYNEFNTRAFMALHTPDVIRVKRESSQIMVGTAYRKNEYRRNSISQSKDWERNLEIRFVDRLVEGAIAYEVGYYRVSLAKPGSSPQVLYGMFHTTLKRIDGEWKIYIDEDEVLDGFSDCQFYKCQPLQRAQK